MNEDRHPLAELRTAAGGITQLELANAVGVSPGMVSRWERRESGASYDHALKADSFLRADGRALEAFGYMPAGTLDRVAALEATTVSRSALAALEARVVSLERVVRRLGLMADLELTDLPVPGGPSVGGEEADPAAR